MRFADAFVWGAATRREGCDMSVDQASDLIRETLLLALIISAPLLVVGLVVGLIVSILQAVTQIQEQTLVFVPKIAAMVAAAIFVTPWLATRLMDFAAVMFGGNYAP
jgi:flagellar biosynthesis protein FliQ